MRLYYLFDEDERGRLNQLGLDYSPAYFSALAAYLGTAAQPLPPSALSQLHADDVLMIAGGCLEKLPSCRVILMGCGKKAAPDPATRREHVFAHLQENSGNKIPLFVPITPPYTQGNTVLEAVDENGERHPALIKHSGGYEFCFDLAANVWFAGDGYHPEKPYDYFFIGRTPDTRPQKDCMGSQPFLDQLLSYLDAILCELGIPSFFALPPMEDGTPPDFMLHFSGDDDCTSKDYNLQAALAMESFGFPYHINAMYERDKGFIMNREEFDEVSRHGCEIALHTNFTGGVPYATETVKEQAELFEKAYGRSPFTNTNHCFIQAGSTAERMRFFYENGILADNGKMGEFDARDINAFDLCGYGFGTAFPRMTCDDAAHENRLIPALEIPIPYYEPRLAEDVSPEKLIAYLEDARRERRIIQFFIHPHYLRNGSSQRAAVLRVLSLLKSRFDSQIDRPLLTTTNQITQFWLDRFHSQIQSEANSIAVDCKTPLLLRLCKDTSGAWVDGEWVHTTFQSIGNKRLCLLPLGTGKHTVTLNDPAPRLL